MKRLFALCLFLLIFPCIALGESLSLGLEPERRTGRTAY